MVQHPWESSSQSTMPAFTMAASTPEQKSNLNLNESFRAILTQQLLHQLNIWPQSNPQQNPAPLRDVYVPTLHQPRPYPSDCVGVVNAMNLQQQNNNQGFANNTELRMQLHEAATILRNANNIENHRNHARESPPQLLPLMTQNRDARAYSHSSSSSSTPSLQEGDPNAVMTHPVPMLTNQTNNSSKTGADSLRLLAQMAVLKQEKSNKSSDAKQESLVGKPLAPPPALGSLNCTMRQRRKLGFGALSFPGVSNNAGLNMGSPPVPSLVSFHKSGVSSSTCSDETITISETREEEEDKSGETHQKMEEEEERAQSQSKRKTNRVQFPEKLHEILQELEGQGRDDIVSFVDQGSCFEIHQPRVFENEILPKYFSNQKGGMGSFKRQLHLYGFSRVKSESRGNSSQMVFKHPRFLKGRPHLCLLMTRVNKRPPKHPTGRQEEAKPLT